MASNYSSMKEVTANVYSIKYIVLISLEIPSILLSLSIFYHFATSRNARSIDHQHSIIVLLVVHFFIVIGDIPITINFYRLDGYVQPSNYEFCKWWIWFDYSLFSMNTSLMAWISIERHLFIFHGHFMRNPNLWKRRILHYLPITFCILWPIIFYSLVFFIVPICTNEMSLQRVVCNLTCYFQTRWGTLDLFFSTIIPVSTILLVNFALVIRVLCQQLQGVARQQINWRNQRKMIMQLAIISLLYLAISTPAAIALVGQTFFDSAFMIQQYDTINFFMYIFSLVLPVVCIPLIPQLMTRLKGIWTNINRTPIAPVQKSLAQTRNLPNSMT